MVVVVDLLVLLCSFCLKVFVFSFKNVELFVMLHTNVRSSRSDFPHVCARLLGGRCPNPQDHRSSFPASPCHCGRSVALFTQAHDHSNDPANTLSIDLMIALWTARSII